jgi:ATP-dependent RNA helicase DHX8/PRP22
LDNKKILPRNEHLKLLSRKFTHKILIATSIICRRVAQELGVPLGQEVGYAIRFEDRTSEKTSIK